MDNGDTVIVVEHNLDLIKCADYVIDLGPDGGINGGQLVAYGTPEEIIEKKAVSYTGLFLEKNMYKDK
ncbi:excinuclease ABC subunit A [Chlamydia trachomatis]|nr:excinuclease ABC subunit A [Chlamydia trachomatis]